MLDKTSTSSSLTEVKVAVCKSPQEGSEMWRGSDPGTALFVEDKYVGEKKQSDQELDCAVRSLWETGRRD